MRCPPQALLHTRVDRYGWTGLCLSTWVKAPLRGLVARQSNARPELALQAPFGDALGVPAGRKGYWQMPASLRRGDLGEALLRDSALSAGDRDRGA